MKPCLLLLSFLFAAAPKSEKPLGLVQNAWDETHTYQADFKQTVFSKRLGTQEEVTGNVSISKPGKIRWDSTSDRTLQILNGKKLYHIHIPKRKRANVVEIYEDISKKGNTRPLSFLAGKFAFRQVYHVDIIHNSEKNIQLKLVPKDSPGAETFIAEFDKKSYLLAALTTESPESRVRIEFSNRKANVELKDDLFEYRPSPTDVVTVNQ